VVCIIRGCAIPNPTVPVVVRVAEIGSPEGGDGVELSRLLRRPRTRQRSCARSKWPGFFPGSFRPRSAAATGCKRPG
jgi:hypothetical protein